MSVDGRSILMVISVFCLTEGPGVNAIFNFDIRVPVVQPTQQRKPSSSNDFRQMPMPGGIYYPTYTFYDGWPQNPGYFYGHPAVGTAYGPSADSQNHSPPVNKVDIGVSLKQPQPQPQPGVEAVIKSIMDAVPKIITAAELKQTMDKLAQSLGQ